MTNLWTAKYHSAGMGDSTAILRLAAQKLYKIRMKSMQNFHRIHHISFVEGRPGSVSDSIQVQVDLNSVLLLPERMKIITYTYIKCANSVQYNRATNCIQHV